MKKFLKIFGIVAIFGLLAGVVGGVAVYMWASKDLPGFKNITDFKPPLVTTVYARDGQVLGYFYREKRFLVKLREIPEHTYRSFLAAEDSGFFEHEGIDLAAIMRAAVVNLKAGHIRQGGSTITQQIIKQLLLTSEKKYKRKLKEAILAYRLEHYLSKEEILTIYLNQIYLGAGAYGVEAAARQYFAKHVGELNIAESALIAGLVQSPSRYNPYRNMESARKRQLYVLDQMHQLGWITTEEYEEALAYPIELKSMPDISWKIGAYYLEEVRRWLIDYLSEDRVKKLGIALDRYGEDAVYESGLHVYTAVDIKHQAAAEKAMRHGLENSSKRRGWRGPVDNLPESEWQTFLSDNSVPPLPEEGAEIDEDDWFKVLVTEVNSRGAVVKLTAEAGNGTAYMPVRTMHWCREIDPSKATEEVPSIKDARRIVKPGDIVWASYWDRGSKDPEPARKDLPLVAIKQRPEVQGALVSIEPENGDVVALVGGYSFETSQFNRATQAERQPGSAFKPIVYSTALDNGFTPATMVLDAPFVYTDYSTDKVWRPENFEGVFYGPTLLRTALVKSRNLVTIRVAQKIGIRRIIDRAKALGLTPVFPEDLSVSLGSVAVSPINLCGAFTAFARGGEMVKPRMVLSVQSAWGEEIYTGEPETHQAISEQNAYIMSTLMKDVVRYGTGWRAKVLRRPLAGKTGTTNEERDAWYMGFSPYLLTGVYVGFDQITPMGKYETGSRAASPIWVEYRQAVENDYPEQDFPQPPGIVHARVDAASGKLAGPGTKESLFLPFYSGTEPTEAEGTPSRDGGSDAATTGEDLLKQMF